MSDVEDRTHEPIEDEDELRDDEGRLKPDYVAAVETAVNDRDKELLNELVGDLHEADLGNLIEALDQDLRPELISILGRDFDFTALTEVDENIRDEIIEELPNSAVALYVQDLESDDADLTLMADGH